MALLDELQKLTSEKSEPWNDKAATILVELAVLAYKSRDIIKKNLGADSTDDLNFQWFESIGPTFDTQAFAFQINNNIVVAFRGTQEIRDFLTDVMAKRTTLMGYNQDEEICKEGVHYGFNHALDAIWDENTKAYKDAFDTPEMTLSKYLNQFKGCGHDLWLTGHSLGGALATIAAAKITRSMKENQENLGFNIAGLVTIGSPRVLGKQPARELETTLGEERIYRIHKSIDPIPQVPFWSYEHVTGRRCYITNNGNLVIEVEKYKKYLDRAYSVIRTAEDLVGSAIPGQRKGLSVLISDHSSEDYLKSVRNWSKENSGSVISVIARMAISLLKILSPPLAILSASVFDITNYWPF